MSNKLKELISSKSILIADGGIVTSLYDRGFYINRNFDELSLTHPSDVQSVSEGFLKAGANLLHTNTFSATLPHLTKYGLQDCFESILLKSCEIVNEVAQDQACTLAAIVPLGVLLEPIGPTSLSEARSLFKQAVAIFEKGNIDGYSLRHFHDLKELEQAVIAIRSLSDRPILAHISLNENFKTSFGNSLEAFVFFADKYDLDVIGFSGNGGPSSVFSALKKIKLLTSRPISVLPNAGLPRMINDEYFFLANPDYISKYTKRMVLAGAKVVGGSSGIHADHIKAMSSAVRMLNPAQIDIKHLFVTETTKRNEVLENFQPTSLNKKSKLGQKLASKEKILSVEINPPTGIEIEKFDQNCRFLTQQGIDFINIPDGARAMARMSSFHTSSYVQSKFNLEPLAHLTCRDRNLIGLQSDLLGAHVNGIRNLLLITGDPPKLGNCPDAKGIYDVDSIGLIHIVSQLNKGLGLGGSQFGHPTEFVIGAALNPTSVNIELEIQRFKYKIEAGVDFFITQPIYDFDLLSRFLDKIKIDFPPIVIGIWPLVSLRNAEFLKNEVPGVSVPDWVLLEMEKAGDDKEEAIKRGFEIALKTMNQASSFAAGFQVNAPFNKVKLAVDVINAL